MFKEVAKEGITYYCESGYRPYNIQKGIYDYYKNTYGDEYVKKYVALPGHSEHQSGLAMDITSIDHVDDEFDRQFGKTKAGDWLSNNSYKYGFILRYPEDKTDITGVNYEPWHFRYVGIDAAKEMYLGGMVLEEYIP